MFAARGVRTVRDHGRHDCAGVCAQGGRKDDVCEAEETREEVRGELYKGKGGIW